MVGVSARERASPATHGGHSIRAAYLNGVFASAAETQHLERLGSSDGSPGQRKLLARIPVIKDSLELRVREPLGDEEMADLRLQNPNLVRDDSTYPGAGSCGRACSIRTTRARTTGCTCSTTRRERFTFGDGNHGRIPPIGSDSILAVRYQKGGGDAAESRQRVGTDQSHHRRLRCPDRGGPRRRRRWQRPSGSRTLLRFAPANQLMRDRTLTLRDFEMQALQFSPDVAQAHAYQQGATWYSLVVVMAGRRPEPSQNVRRELARYLGSKAVPMLAAHGGIVIERPTVVRIRVDLTLAIAQIEHSADVAPEARRRIATLLDPGLGGVDRTGWQPARPRRTPTLRRDRRRGSARGDPERHDPERRHGRRSGGAEPHELPRSRLRA